MGTLSEEVRFYVFFFLDHSMNNGFISVSGRGPTHVADNFEFRETQYDN